jgi:hypothetical protein
MDLIVFLLALAAVIIAYFVSGVFKNASGNKTLVAKFEQQARMAALGFEQAPVSVLNREINSDAETVKVYDTEIIWQKVKTCIDITEPGRPCHQGGQGGQTYSYPPTMPAASTVGTEGNSAGA